MEFVSINSIVGLIAGFGSFCLAVSILGYQHRKPIHVATAVVLVLLAVVVSLVSYVRPHDSYLTWHSEVFPYALLVFSYFYTHRYFARELSLKTQCIHLVLIAVFSAVTMRVLFLSGLFLGLPSEVFGIIIGTSLCGASLRVQLMASLNTIQTSNAEMEPLRPSVQR